MNHPLLQTEHDRTSPPARRNRGAAQTFPASAGHASAACGKSDRLRIRRGRPRSLNGVRWPGLLAGTLLPVFLATGYAGAAHEKAGIPDLIHCPPGRWVSLFDGKRLGGWRPSDFGGAPEQEVHVRNGCIELDFGAADLSGVTWTGPVPRIDYELELEACRADGHDFFCGLTFPYKTSCCTLIVGGWGGSIVGLSSFDDLDASQNETTRSMEFRNGVWYHIRLRVRNDRIEAWIDDKKVVDARPGERRVGIRSEVEPSRPLGIAAWNTRALLRNIRFRRLPRGVGTGASGSSRPGTGKK